MLEPLRWLGYERLTADMVHVDYMQLGWFKYCEDFRFGEIHIQTEIKTPERDLVFISGLRELTEDILYGGSIPARSEVQKGILYNGDFPSGPVLAQESKERAVFRICTILGHRFLTVSRFYSKFKYVIYPEDVKGVAKALEGSISRILTEF